MSTQLHRYELAMEIGEEAVRQGHWRQALTCFQTAIIGLPDEARIYNGLGDTYRALAEPDRALAYYKEAARLADGDALYSEKIAALHEEMGQAADAAAAYRHAGDRLWHAGQHDRARANWEQAVRLEPDRPGIHQRLAMSDEWRGDVAGAVGHYLLQAGTLHRDGQCLAALHVAYLALAFQPEDAEVWRVAEGAWRCVATRQLGQGRVAARVEPGDLVSAATEFAQWQLTHHLRESAARRDSRAAGDLFLRAAMAHEAAGRAGQAILAYERAVVAGAQLPAVFFALGLLYRLVGRRADARAALTLAARHAFYRRVVALLD